MFQFQYPKMEARCLLRQHSVSALRETDIVLHLLGRGSTIVLISLSVNRNEPGDQPSNDRCVFPHGKIAVLFHVPDDLLNGFPDVRICVPDIGIHFFPFFKYLLIGLILFARRLG